MGELSSTIVSNFKKISNPLTIIAIFAGLAEINGTVVMGLVPANLQGVFIWFIIFFPTALVLIFFLTLNFNPKVLYAPSDFSNEENFLKTLGKSIEKFDAVKIDVTQENFQEFKELDAISSSIKKREIQYLKNDLLNLETSQHISMANAFWKFLYKKLYPAIEKKIINQLSFGIEAPEYFIITYAISASETINKANDYLDSIIVRITEDEKGELNLIAIGKDIVDKDPERFSEKVSEFVGKKIKQITAVKK